MIFKELILENFGPYRGRNIINLAPITAENNAPIVLIGGMNGGGKTTLLDSLKLALYGRRAECAQKNNSSYNDFLLTSINRHAKLGENTKIELTFEHLINDQWIELKIVRQWQHNVKDGKDNLGIIEGEFPDVNLMDNWDDYIEEVLPLGISNLFLFDGEQVKELAEKDTPSPLVISAIRSLLGLELADQLSIDLDVLISRKQKASLQETEQKQLTQLEKELQALENNRKLLVKDLDSAEKQLKQAQKIYNKTSISFREEGNKIASKKSQLQQKRAETNKQIAEIYDQLKQLASQYLPLNLITSALHQLKQQLAQEEENKKLINAHELLTIKDQELLNFLKDLQLSADNYSKIEFYIDNKQKENQEKIKVAHNYLAGKEKDFLYLQNLLTYNLPNQQQKAQELIEKNQELNQELNNLDSIIAQTKSPKTYQELESAYNQAHQEVINSKSQLEILKKERENLDRNITTTKKKIATYSDKKINDLDTKHLTEMMPKVKETLVLFQEKIIQKKLNRLELEITNSFRYLLHKSNFVQRIALDEKDFSLSIYGTEGNQISKNRLSAGEKQLLAISLLWGLAKVTTRPLPVAIDTPLARLDSSHRHNLLERYFPSASHQVILLSTDTEIGEMEVQQLRQQEVINREYLLDYDSKTNETTIKTGYFF